MMSNLQTLIDMGFTEQRASQALELTGDKGVEPAMEWLLAHADATPMPNTDGEASGSTDHHPAGGQNESETLILKPDEMAEQTAKSIKCNECNRLFKTQMEVEFHAAKSGHVDFAESTEEKKPLTEEEKKEQMAKLEQKLKQKRIERDEREKADALERERLRIKSGKDMSEARRKMEEDEMKKLVELRKREKQDEKVARERVKAQIENDKIARKNRMQAETSATLTAAAAAAPVPISPISSPTSGGNGATTQYVQTRIQVRLQNGQALTQTFNVKEQLAAVRLFVQLNNVDSQAPFALMTTFPRKVFVEEDYEKPLDVLGLVPSAVIIVTKV